MQNINLKRKNNYQANIQLMMIINLNLAKSAVKEIVQEI